MANKRFMWGILALTLVFGMMVLSAQAFEAIDPIEPDKDSAVVYFFGSRGLGDIWDGDRLVGTFIDKKISRARAGIVYKTTPGTHYFMVNASNWAIILANLEPNKRYYVQVAYVPSPPFTTLVTMRVLEPEQADEWTKRIKKYFQFTDAWRTEYAQGKRFENMQIQYEAAKKSETDVTLSGIHGR